ncbi:TPA thiamine biosynthesis protein [Gloeophyllum trabeum ATCC 11539]|uniref:4-amino-5-hydroxymethyl-2-methylpyrimidine phosphate synthase n=1 Tax=Gloeophyllum trabeum (strain ATCC 11539 / FP-39264 / Madison 617) TaxID=670483 RepID=S7RK52_GLOTA|nr:TPA thiamine biosynthesis protein [Gloeophyllum trabeum ATCC 11539]EPQ52999.1 TPA thiamine biosynthesis protein [Gloeophyllum trabeum ATCC 11539]
MSTDKITFLLNWHATPYHAPIFLAQSKGYFAEEGIKVAIIEPNDPSDVTEIIGSGKIDMGAKAMIHTIAGAARGFPIRSVGTLMDPFTGVIYLEGSGVTSDFRSLKGKRIGYVGEFGKVQIDELTRYYGMKPSDYQAIRVGMNVSQAIINGSIDAGIGLENVQQCELEEWLKERGRPPSDVKMLRIDQLAELGCCCFCSILYIANEPFLKANPEKVKAFMRAVKKAADYLFAQPAQAWEEYKLFKKSMNTPLNAKIFERSFTYMSMDCANVPRDWHKVTNYCKRLGVVGQEFEPNYSNDYLSWPRNPDVADPDENQRIVAAKQEEVKAKGGVLSGAPAINISAASPAVAVAA